MPLYGEPIIGPPPPVTDDMSPSEREAAEHEIRKYFYRTYRGVLPKKKLTPSVNPEYTPCPRLLHYGIGYKSLDVIAGQSLGAYAREHNLVVTESPDLPDFYHAYAVYETMEKCVKHLSEHTRHNLELIVPYSFDYDFIIAIYSNYSLSYDGCLVPEEEKEVLDDIRKAIGDKKQEPMWYFNVAREYGHMRYPNGRLDTREE
ncbi:hypothetical protein K488DRAFT_89068 [Vararia minispora EC-137]|uniref:Uncharacterized protein n=1 Tax=Vararia minispora EC-137 TaxID=1314806 RepID=A0ACB8QC29_9AGAM|nr:hypothetical protein K488DRAFT_89068 [Vararia minispora EC-137]